MTQNLKLDIFPHIFPQPFFERMKAMAEQNPSLAGQIKRWLHIPVLWDLEARLRMVNKHDLPIWVHPTRTAKFADYVGESKSKYEIYWLFGWPYETSVFMARMVFSGMLEKLPGLKIITHHLGAMAPFFDERIGLGMDQLGSRTSDEDYTAILKRMAKRPVDYFRMFYADTSVNGSRSATRCGLDFFGADHVLFGTDCPFDPEGGPLFIREIIKAIDSLKFKDGDRRKVYFGNAIRMLRLELPDALKEKPKSRSRPSRANPRKKAKKGK